MVSGYETKSFFAANKKLQFILLCLISLLLLYVKISFIENDTAAFEFLQDRPEGFILQLLNGLKFISIPLVYLWKFTVIGFALWLGCFMFGYRITFVQCWGVAVAAEYVFLIPEILKILWFMAVETDPSYYEVSNFYPFSLINLVDTNDLDKRWAYPLRALNIFEVIYWFILVEGIHSIARKDKKYTRIIVACSYVLLFFLWLGYYAMVYD